MLENLQDMGKVFFLILCLCSVALTVIRCMGNRTVGQLSPFDFIIMVGMGDIIVTTAMDDNQTFWKGVGGLLALLILQQVLSYISLKSTFWRRIFEGVPVVLIQDGRLINENFAKTRFNYDDLRQELHKLGMDMTDVPKIRLARLESCGVFSVVRDKELEPLTKYDMTMLIKQIEEEPLSPLGRLWQRFVKLEKLIFKLSKQESEK